MRMPQNQSVHLYHSPAIPHRFSCIFFYLWLSSANYIFSKFLLVLFAVLLVSRATSSRFIFSNCYRKRNSFTNFSCLWQPITQIELPVFPLRTGCSLVVFWHIEGIAELWQEALNHLSLWCIGRLLTVLIKNKNTCCLLYVLISLFSLFPGVKLGSTPRQSREVCVYSICPKTQVHKLLSTVICCKEVIVRLVALSMSDSICDYRPSSPCATSQTLLSKRSQRNQDYRFLRMEYI